MKNYGLQVKEIPIVFRGTIDEATPSTPTVLIYDSGGKVARDYTMPSGVSTWCLFNEFIPDFIPVGTTHLNFTFNDVEYKNLPITFFEGEDMNSQINQLGEVGAAFISDNYVWDETSDFPFSFAYDVELDKQMFMIFWKEDKLKASFKIEIPGVDGGTTKKVFEADLTGNGQINHFRARFACGENGTLHLRPYVILNGNIRVDLCNFAQGGDQYIAGDNEEIEFDCYVPIETHASAYVEAENTGEYPSLVDAAMTVQYEDFIEKESIVGYEGVNLRRGRR